jgi:hypothetical protein
MQLSQLSKTELDAKLKLLEEHLQAEVDHGLDAIMRTWGSNPVLDDVAWHEEFSGRLGLSRDGRIRMPARGLPSPLLQVAIVMNKFGAEIAAPRIPARVQRVAWRALAALGRLRGYQSSFPEYGAP